MSKTSIAKIITNLPTELTDNALHGFETLKDLCKNHQLTMAKPGTCVVPFETLMNLNPEQAAELIPFMYRDILEADKAVATVGKAVTDLGKEVIKLDGRVTAAIVGVGLLGAGGYILYKKFCGLKAEVEALKARVGM